MPVVWAAKAAQSVCGGEKTARSGEDLQLSRPCMAAWAAYLGRTRGGSGQPDRCDKTERGVDDRLRL